MQTKLGNDTDEVTAALAKAGIGRTLAQQAIELAQEQGRFTGLAFSRRPNVGGLPGNHVLQVL